MSRPPPLKASSRRWSHRWNLQVDRQKNTVMTRDADMDETYVLLLGGNRKKYMLGTGNWCSAPPEPNVLNNHVG